MKRLITCILVISLFLCLSQPHSHVNATQVTDYDEPISANSTIESESSIEIYANTSTQDLVSQILESDIPFSLLASNTTIQDTYNHLRNISTILQELELRGDSSSVMLEFFIASIQSSQSTDDYDAIAITTLKYLLEQPIFFNQLTDIEIVNYNTALLNYKDCTAFVGTFNSSNVSTQSITPRSANEDMYVDADIEAYTLAGQRIPLLTTSYELTSDSIVAINEHVVSNYDVIKISNPTAKYNCHSYAWYLQSSSNQYWLDYPTVYTNDTHNDELTAPVVGAICIYYDSTLSAAHSAVIISVRSATDFTVRSKWGSWGLYEHEYDEVTATYTCDGTNVNCRFFERATSHTGTTYTNYSSTQHKSTCAECSKVIYFSHTCTITNKNASGHTRKCTKCTFTATEAHVMNIITGMCKICSYSGPGTATPEGFSKRPITIAVCTHES